MVRLLKRIPLWVWPAGIGAAGLTIGTAIIARPAISAPATVAIDPPAGPAVTVAPPTQTVTAPVSTATVTDADPCKADRATYCAEFNSPDWEKLAAAAGYITASHKLGLVDCFDKHRDSLSAACVASLDTHADANEAVKADCGTYMGSLCSGITPVPGAEPMFDCLKSKVGNGIPADSACAVSLAAHEAGKRK